MMNYLLTNLVRKGDALPCILWTAYKKDDRVYLPLAHNGVIQEFAEIYTLANFSINIDVANLGFKSEVSNPLIYAYATSATEYVIGTYSQVRDAVRAALKTHQFPIEANFFKKIRHYIFLHEFDLATAMLTREIKENPIRKRWCERELAQLAKLKQDISLGSINQYAQTAFSGKWLLCKECGAEFVFTAAEQEFYASRGFSNEPQRCKKCRESRKAAARSPHEYFSATCTCCGGEAKVPFEAKTDRPAYCSDCLLRLRKQDE